MNVMPSTSVSAEIEISVVFDSPNVAVSAGPLGTPIGVQLSAVFQSPEIGSRSHWALIAYAGAGESAKQANTSGMKRRASRERDRPIDSIKRRVVIFCLSC